MIILRDAEGNKIETLTLNIHTVCHSDEGRILLMFGILPASE
ncbi:hypothetical protein WH221_16895 [Chryseobacterium culicis]|nr:hypothetical protein [Chryseobacterium culicis]